MKKRIIVVDDEASTREAMVEILERQGYEVTGVGTGEACLEEIEAHEYDLVLTDLIMPGVNGLKILERALFLDPHAKVIMITGYGSVETAVQAMHEGAYHYVEKPVRPAVLKELVKKALERRSLEIERSDLQNRLDEQFGFESVVGSSPAMKHVFELVRRVAPTDSTVLITGESGTGKEVVAELVHQHSPRKDRPFVKVNCAALVEGLLESELFGHVKGAFTGALRDKKGKFQLAHGGSILLDEIAEMSLALQSKLLRVLQEGEVERVGGLGVERVDVRVISATNKNLLDRVREGLFREDLYYRLKVVHFELPPLRDRREDIPLFVNRFLGDLARRHGRKIEAVSPDLMAVLRAHDWPGNVRELRNCIEGMVVTSLGTVLERQDLPAELRGGVDLERAKAGGEGGDVPVNTTIAEMETRMIQKALAETGGNRTQAARMLGVSLRTLQRKLKSLDEGGEPEHV